jgi:hypothetical protein
LKHPFPLNNNSNNSWTDQIQRWYIIVLANLIRYRQEVDPCVSVAPYYNESDPKVRCLLNQVASYWEVLDERKPIGNVSLNFILYLQCMHHHCN